MDILMLMQLFLPVFRALDEAGARYVLVGGVATVLHGAVRTTKDIDLIIDLEPNEVVKTIGALLGAGFVPHAPVNPLDFADPRKRDEWIREKGLVVFSMRSQGG